MRFVPLALLALVIGNPGWAQDGDGISTPVLSRCAGRIGLELRAADGAFGAVALDGVPWLTIERVEDTVGSQPIAQTATGSGLFRRRDGRLVPIRFTCMLDARDQAVMFHVSHLMPQLGDELPPATLVNGSASYRDDMTLPRGIELRLQLLDITRLPTGELLAEQVVRSGWQAKIPFALRVPRSTQLDGRKLVLTARLVLAHQTLFQLAQPRPLTFADLRTPLVLVLEKAPAGR